jgi:RimJ/RimL family protein N-acetyltransferase
MVTIRHITAADTEGFLLLAQTIDQETTFMLRASGERPMTVAAQREQLLGLLCRPNHTILVVEDAGKLVGYLSAAGGAYCRNRHTVRIAIGLLQTHTGQGIGQQLLAALEMWARGQALHRVELTVMTHNTRAIRLYTRMGFLIEGTKHHALLVNGTYVDEYTMPGCSNNALIVEHLACILEAWHDHCGE